MFLLDSLLIGGLRFVLEKVSAAADAEAHDDAALREQLLEAQLRLDEGELTPAEFADIERDILARIREIKGQQGRGPLSVSGSDRIGGVEIDTFDD